MRDFSIQMLENKSSLFSHLTKWGLCPKHDNDSNQDFISYFIFIFYSTTKHEIKQIKKSQLLCSLDPPNQRRLF